MRKHEDCKWAIERAGSIRRPTVETPPQKVLASKDMTRCVVAHEDQDVEEIWGGTSTIDGKYGFPDNILCEGISAVVTNVLPAVSYSYAHQQLPCHLVSSSMYRR